METSNSIRVQIDIFTPKKTVSLDTVLHELDDVTEVVQRFIDQNRLSPPVQ